MIVDPEKFQSRSGNSDVHAIEIDDNKIEKQQILLIYLEYT